ncbi:MAG: tetraacyldisaccharide 4'-kinase, partial [bacterium]
FLLTRSNLGSFADANEAFLREIAPNRPVFRVDFVANELQMVGPAAEVRPSSSLKDANVAAFCGLAQPDSFYRSLRLLGARPVFTQNFPDHHHYSEADLRELASEASRSNAEMLVTTEKDAVKLQRLRPPDFPLWSLGIKPDFGNEESRFERLLTNLLDSARAT